MRFRKTGSITLFAACLMKEIALWPNHIICSARVKRRRLELPQVFFYMQILNIAGCIAAAEIQDIFPGDWAVTVLCFSALLLIGKMTVLLRDGFSAVFDCKNLAGAGSGIKYYHIKFPHRKLQDEDLLLGIGQHGFQKDNVFQHPALDFAPDPR